MTQAKPFPVTKRQVWEAYKRVKANKGGAGVDGQTLEDFERDVGDNLYKLWNRMASGSYMPPAVKRVEIPKEGGGVRPLGVPTVADRVAQMVVKQALEPELEGHFHPDSYGYRPGKSAHQAIGQARKRCWRNDWVLDLDIKGFLESSSYCSPTDANGPKGLRLMHNSCFFSYLLHDASDSLSALSANLTHCNSALRGVRLLKHAYKCRLGPGA